MVFLSILMLFAEARSRQTSWCYWLFWYSLLQFKVDRHKDYRMLEKWVSSYIMPVVSDSLTWLYPYAYRLRAWVSWCCVLSRSIAQTAQIHFQALTKVYICPSRLQFVLTNNSTSWGCKNSNLTTVLRASELQVAITFSIVMKTKCSLLSQSIAQTARTHFHRTKGFI